MNGKIDNAATTLLSIPLKRPVEGHPYLGRRATSNFVILRLKTEDGLIGWGLAHTSTIGKARAPEVEAFIPNDGRQHDVAISIDRHSP